MGTMVLAVRHVLLRDADVPDGSEVEDGVEAGEHLLRSSIASCGVAVLGRLTHPFKGLAQWDINGAFPSEIGLAAAGQRRQ